jgi:putative peptidoglycan lipid II flippase
MIAGSIVTVVSLPVYWALHRAFGSMGLAWASNFAIALQTVTLAAMAHRRYLVPLFGPAGGLDAREIARAFAAACVSFAGLWTLLRLIPVRQTYLGDAGELALGGLVWAGLCFVTLRVTGSTLIAQIRTRKS